ncbi:MAG: nucleotide exchange factor GrpE [Lachnospiraceae bacterium]|nr:nucleotide exchange factor GrpE [Lachnospiraceae bacterium]MDD6183082.1 nucleotide exchange factor GrpE [Lachnospiraceae bacterium]MDD7379385.1 nucleotide exchange factor GrpE [Lachnospiraceae bacterium]MDY4617329.1 nucleotide exchange factor GrpE [Lachnospiraceae bacterium]MDY5774781.1 nucleotide exchange factor GrpE [Lachnospiraceae bacterium]
MAENKKDEEILEEILEDLEEEASAKETEQEETKEEVEEKETSEEQPKEEKKSKSKKKKDKKDEQIEELQDQVKRQMAEFDNFRKRTEKEKNQMFEVGAKSIIEKILPVVDNFERGLASIPEEEQGSAFADGMNMIYKQLLNELEQAGVAVIEAVGKEFDPEYHNAVMQVENDELEPGTIAQELQKGYTYRDSVVRHSMVAVVQE